MYTSVVQCIHAEKFAIDLGADHLTFEGVMGDFRLRLTSREKKSCKVIPGKKIPTLKMKFFMVYNDGKKSSQLSVRKKKKQTKSPIPPSKVSRSPP